MIKGSIQEELIKNIVKISHPKQENLFMRQILTDIKGENDSKTTVGTLTLPLASMDRPS